jgi:hypothetical protein
MVLWEGEGLMQGTPILTPSRNCDAAPLRRCRLENVFAFERRKGFKGNFPHKKTPIPLGPP